MPGFNINSTGGDLNPKIPTTDWLRNHRFLITEFFGIAVNNRQGFLAVKDISLPDKKIKDHTVQTIGTEYKFAQSASYSELKINFYGTKDALVTLNELHDQPHSLANGIGDFNEYSGIVRFVIYSEPDRSEGVEYKYVNAWVSDVTNGQVTYSSSDIKDIGVTISFSFFEVRKVGQSAGLILDRQTQASFSTGGD